MLGANCSDEPSQTPSAPFPNTHIFLVLQADARVIMCSFRQKQARVSSDVTQINVYPLKSRRGPTNIYFIVYVCSSPAVESRSRLYVKRVTVRVYARTSHPRPDKYV